MKLLYNIFAFWPNFIREVVLLMKFSQAVKSIRSELEAEGLRVDWFGRIYTVVNLPTEAFNQPEMIQQSMVFKDLKPINDIMMRCGLSDYAYPLIEKINEKNTAAFLVVLYPETDYFNFWRCLWNSLFLGCVIWFSLFIIDVVPNIIDVVPNIIDWFKTM